MASVSNRTYTELVWLSRGPPAGPTVGSMHRAGIHNSGFIESYKDGLASQRRSWLPCPQTFNEKGDHRRHVRGLNGLGPMLELALESVLRAEGLCSGSSRGRAAALVEDRDEASCSGSS